MRFSYSAVWEDTVRLIRGNASLLIALAGVFMFLPALLMGYFLPAPPAATMTELARLAEEYFHANWAWMLLANLANMAGALAMLQLLFGARPTVGQAIAHGLALLPFYFLATILSDIMIGIGAILILPGFYLFGRMAVLAPVMAAEDRRNPIDAIGRSFALSRGNGWAVIGLVVMVAVTAFVLSFLVNAIFGSVFIILLGQHIGGMLALIVRAVTSAAFSTLMVILFAAIYRRLAGESAAGPN
ncbi:hypothetical protein [Sphingosinicella rhizophila]|uniref:Glycerophosphoryl diester phosphodiesterase membrane domain-containing protein n=1 Tax=Sphingosinicella rhizophila TaxID=3050082 RepID=A0ABU3Q8V6_9SPHN|nr:hypothetical protein [Sphingosinicella sp. GR2756]MDT9599843.1 hypothetical protein [Sphingosinicella sp. GR2756]